MKKYVLLLLLLAAGFSLCAQAASSAEVFVFLQPISGTGTSPNDKTYITQMLTNEMRARNCTLLDSPRGAGYILYGSITPYYGNYDAPQTNTSNAAVFSYNTPLHDTGEQWYIFQLTLRNAKTNSILTQQNLFYASIDEMYGFFPLMTHNLFAQIFPAEQTGSRSSAAAIVDSGEWLNKWLYFGFGGFWAPRIYTGTTQSVLYTNFGVNLSMELQFIKYMAIELGAEFVPEWVAYSTGNDLDIMLEVPLSLKWIIRLADHHILSPYGGAHYNVSLWNENITVAPFSWMAGVMYGVRAGSGIFFVNSRFSMDMQYSHLRDGQDTLYYRRQIIHVGIGYKFGAIPK